MSDVTHTEAAPQTGLESIQDGDMNALQHGVEQVLHYTVDWEATAAWVQAIGSTVGLGVALWVGADAAQSAKQSREQAEQHRRKRVEAVQWSALHVATQAGSVIEAAEFMVNDPEALESLRTFGFGDWNFDDLVRTIDAIPIHEAESVDVMHCLGRIKILVRAAQTRMPMAIQVLRKHGGVPDDILKDFNQRTLRAKELTGEMAAAIISPAPG